MTITTYNTGAASVSAGGTTVTGAGVIWSGGNAREGDEFVIDGVRALILEVVSATELTITPWQGGNESGAAYTIYQASSRRFDDVQIADDLQKQVAALNTDGFYHFVKSSETAPDPSLGDEGQYAFQATTGKLWLKEGGVWVFVGIFKGVIPKGPWDSATDYAVNDLVSSGGSSYLAVAASTNDAPPSANWMLFAEKGDTGSTGDTGATGPGYGGTSTSSLVIGTGSKAITTQAGLAYQVGSRVRLSVRWSIGNWMEGQVIEYTGSAMTVQVTHLGGSGLYSDWTLSVAGEIGPSGDGSGDMVASAYDPKAVRADAFDSANHAFLQAGVDAIPRPALLKMRSFVHASDYGPSGTRSSLQKAINDVDPGISVYLDTVNYVLDAPVLLKAGVKIAGNNAVVTQPTGAGLPNFFDAETNSASGAIIEDVIFDGNRDGNDLNMDSSCLLLAYDANNLTLRRCQFNNSTGYGIIFNDGVNSVVEDSSFYRVASVPLIVNSGAQTSHIIRRNTMSSYGQHGVLLLGAGGNVISQNRFDGSRANVEVSKSGSTVTRISGPPFNAYMTGFFLIANGGAEYLILEVNSPDTLTVHISDSFGISSGVIGQGDHVAIHDANSNDITDNRISSGASIGVSIAAGTGNSVGNMIARNRIEGVASAGVSIQAVLALNVDTAITDNFISSSARGGGAMASDANVGIHVWGGASTVGVLVDGNVIVNYDEKMQYGIAYAAGVSGKLTGTNLIRGYAVGDILNG